MNGLIIDKSYTDTERRYLFIQLDSIASITKDEKGKCKIIYGKGSFLLTEEGVSVDELAIRDYADYLKLCK